MEILKISIFIIVFGGIMFSVYEALNYSNTLHKH